jgi:CTP:molybdopterin cytidylyltransferase MocA
MQVSCIDRRFQGLKCGDKTIDIVRLLLHYSGHHYANLVVDDTILMLAGQTKLCLDGSPMKKLMNITSAKRDLLRLVNELQGEVIITRDSRPVARLSRLPAAPATGKPALILLAARPCEARIKQESIANLDAVADLFSKFVVVYSRETEPELQSFKHHNLFVIETAKPTHPIITSLKAGISGLEESDAYFMFAFLNRPVVPARCRRLTEALSRAEAEGKGIVVPVVGGRPTHPLVFAARYRENILKIRKELGVPHIIKRHREDIFYVAMD